MSGKIAVSPETAFMIGCLFGHLQHTNPIIHDQVLNSFIRDVENCGYDLEFLRRRNGKTS